MFHYIIIVPDTGKYLVVGKGFATAEAAQAAALDHEFVFPGAVVVVVHSNTGDEVSRETVA